MPLSVYLFLILELLVVAYMDIIRKKIPNLWALINIITFSALVFIFPQSYSFSLQTFIYPLAFFGVGFMLFTLKIMGGGDSKYLSSFYLLIPLPLHENAFLCLLYSTIVVGGVLLLRNIIKSFDKIYFSIKNRDVGGIKKAFGSRFSYAPVIFISWVWFGWEIRKIIFF